MKHAGRLILFITSFLYINSCFSQGIFPKVELPTKPITIFEKFDLMQKLQNAQDNIANREKQKLRDSIKEKEDLQDKLLGDISGEVGNEQDNFYAKSLKMIDGRLKKDK